jgi:hypothetical protein
MQKLCRARVNRLQIKFSSENFSSAPARDFARQLLAKYRSAFRFTTQDKQLSCSVPYFIRASPSKFLLYAKTLSGQGESNTRFTHPMGMDYHYPMAR